jgi:glycosyltransferase involved in cell wall biosynthesis
MGKVLYFSHGYTTHDFRFLEGLARTSYEIWFLSMTSPSDGSEHRSLPFGVHSLPPLLPHDKIQGPVRWLSAIWKLRKCLRKLRPDLVHAGPVPTAGFLAALCGCHPLLLQSWGSDLLVTADQTLLQRWIARFALRHADMVFADCQAVQEKASQLAPLRLDQFILFPWGVDLSKFFPRPSTVSIRKQQGWEKKYVIIHTRGFEPIHGPLVFLESMRRVLTQRTDIGVLMLGGGSLRPKAEVLLREWKIEDHFYLPGRVSHPQLPDYFNEANLYVSTTFSDGSSISLLEAMACGLPAIVVDRYGNPEWIRPGINGWLYPAGDAGALAQAILDALENESLRRSMSSANVILVKDRADWARNFAKLPAAYARLIALKEGNKTNAEVSNR